MGIEIERKFLVVGDSWRSQSAGLKLYQGYLHASQERTVRVRIVGGRGFLAIKGPTENARRMEFEYAIPAADARVMLETLAERPLIEKERYLFSYEGCIWEIDVFSGENAGLVVAEIELTSEESTFVAPSWLGQEVTDDPRYYNCNLWKHPFSRW